MEAKRTSGALELASETGPTRTQAAHDALHSIGGNILIEPIRKWKKPDHYAAAMCIKVRPDCSNGYFFFFFAVFFAFFAFFAFLAMFPSVIP
jgi:hypothetical protein